jgi:hypothetical protein
MHWCIVALSIVLFVPIIFFADSIDTWFFTPLLHSLAHHRSGDTVYTNILIPCISKDSKEILKIQNNHRTLIANTHPSKFRIPNAIMLNHVYYFVTDLLNFKNTNETCKTFTLMGRTKQIMSFVAHVKIDAPDFWEQVALYKTSAHLQNMLKNEFYPRFVTAKENWPEVFYDCQHVQTNVEHQYDFIYLADSLRPPERLRHLRIVRGVGSGGGSAFYIRCRTTSKIGEKIPTSIWLRLSFRHPSSRQPKRHGACVYFEFTGAAPHVRPFAIIKKVSYSSDRIGYTKEWNPLRTFFFELLQKTTVSCQLASVLINDENIENQEISLTLCD